MKQMKNKAFTLIELIVVITILAILGTIAFISLQGYSKDARNSVRISDMKSVEKVLELFSLKTGKYPKPDSFQVVTFSGGTVDMWYKGEIGENVMTNLERLSSLPKDPKTEVLMGYSTTLSQTEYELKYDLELSNNNHFIVNKTNASFNGDIVKGNYNGLYLLGGDNNYYSIPGLHMSGTLLDGETEFNLDNQNISYQSQILTHSGVIITANNLRNNYVNFALSLQDAYSGASDLDTGIYAKVQEITLETAEDFGKQIVGKSITRVTSTTTSDCDNTTKPADNGHITYTINPVSENQEYLQNSGECGFTCETGYVYNGTICALPYSCKEILDDDPSKSGQDGNYTIDPQNNGTGFIAYCDMTTDGGGYTLYPVSSGLRTYKYTDNDTCKTLGMNLFIPRTRNHFSAVVTKYGISYFETMPGIYNLSVGDYTNCIMRDPNTYGTGCSGWRALDGHSWWIRNSVRQEPNGDYTAGCWLGIYAWASGSVSNIDDIKSNDNNCGYSTIKYICSTNDKY